MTYVEQAIQKAIEGGYKSRYQELDGEIACNDFFAHLFLDPLFWQSLGKSLGWGETKEEEEEMKGESLLSLWPMEWQVYWHCFIDHLAEGKDAESFFESLINVKE